MDILKIIAKKIRGVGRRTGLMDDFDWAVYNEQEYAKQIADLEKQYTFILPDNKYSLSGGKIVLAPGLLPLNEHHQALYEAVYALAPQSVLEVGCGCGDHLANIKKLLPGVQLSGLDLLQPQLDFLYKRHPELKAIASLHIQDMTAPMVKKVKADLVYTQAVLMHIQRHYSYLQALRNFFSLSNKYVVLAENWTRHHFFDDIKKISKEEGFTWKEVYFYTYDAGKQVSLIVSATPLASVIFKEIKSNEELLTYYK